MMRFNGLILAVALFCAAAAHGVTVSGYALLSGGDSDAGTKILFTASSPSAATDSTYTDSDGHFSISLAPGVYDVTYSHEGYASYPLPDQALLFDTELEQVLLLPPISGSLSGTIGPGLFQVVDTIRIGQRAYLNILPGTHFFFDGPHPFIVEGLLEAIGTEQDSIVFTRRYPTDASRWGGVLFENNPSGDSCRMEYCVVEWAYRGNVYEGAKGAIDCRSTSPMIKRCTVRNNAATGIVAYGGHPTIRECAVVHNRASYGAGMSFWNAEPLVVNCQIAADTAYRGGGIYCSGGTVTTDMCDIGGNGAMDGAGICAVSGSQLIAVRSVIHDNYAQDYSYGGGVAVQSAHAVLVECTITANTGDIFAGAGTYEGQLDILNCTFAFNRAQRWPNQTAAVGHHRGQLNVTSTIVALSRGAYAFNVPSTECTITYCLCFGNDAGSFYGGPPAIGIIALTNANGDSCDTYYNIFLDPLLADTAAGDYHLTEGSPCIDAGDPSLPYDPDGTVADIGAFYYDQTEAVRDFGRNALRPYRLIGNYPNPFNAATRIGFELERTGDVRLFVYDITGRLVRTLMNASLSGGSHEVVFDAGNLPSGIYLYRLEAGGRIESRKMVLLK